MATGVLSFFDTHFAVGTISEAAVDTIWESHNRYIVMWNTNFAPLCGILCTGYFLHTVSIPIIRASKSPERKYIELFWGYFAVMISYIACGVLGYYGFIGYAFRSYFEGNPVTGAAAHSQID